MFSNSHFTGRQVYNSTKRRNVATRSQVRRGNISLVYLIFCLVCTIMIVFLMNIGHVAHQKLQMQNAADAASISAATWLTRGMNSITATNHVMGEMTGIIVVHDALGGKKLDTNKVAEETNQADSRLTQAYYAAQGMGAQTPAYETVREQSGVRASKTLLDAKIVLKEMLAGVYWAKVSAKLMQESGIYPIVAAGKALELAMDLLEYQILQEYRFLNLMHQIARGLVPLKQTIRDRMLPAARDYTEHVVETFPRLAERAGRIAGRELGVEVEYFPRRLSLPVMKDPHRYAMVRGDRPEIDPRKPTPPNPSSAANSMREQIVKTSQLARATFPWVNYHRQPVLRILGALAPLSQATHYYKDWTDGTTKRMLDKLQQPGRWDLGLYVLKGATPPDKGYEAWTEDRDKLDRLFSVQAFAKRPKLGFFGSDVFFQQHHSAGRIAVSQALVYNGNRQKRNAFYIPLKYKRIIPERQADVGWDTLNWKEGTRPYELVAKTRKGSVVANYPEVQVNWQSKLVPISPVQLGRAKSNLPPAYAAILKKVTTKYPRLLSH